MAAADEASRVMCKVGWHSEPPHARMTMCRATDGEDGDVKRSGEGSSAGLLERDTATARGGVGEADLRQQGCFWW